MTDEPDMFATSDDLERRWHKLTDEERQKADTHLADVTDYIKERSPIWRRLLDERPRLLIEDHLRHRPQNHAGRPVRHSRRHHADEPDHRQLQRTIQFRSATGDLWLRDDEKRILGINAQRAFSVDMATGETS